MQSSGDAGVIIFSMGSYINAMDTDKANMIAEAFAKLPQKVLWKLGGQPPTKIPPNVKISKWLPQNDLLGELLNAYIICQVIFINMISKTILNFRSLGKPGDNGY